jgi:carbon storage regulator
MLVLSRKIGEKIVIGEDVVITVSRIDRRRIRLAIEAPKSVPILRDRRDHARPGIHETKLPAKG